MEKNTSGFFCKVKAFLRKGLASVKESLRKTMVSIKRNPQIIPMLMLVASFLLYALNLTHVSNTTAKLNGANMGLCQFAIMLLTLLSMVCMLNAFPRRKKANIPMIVLMYIMFALIVLASVVYTNGIENAWYRELNPIPPDEKTMYTIYAYQMLWNFRIMICVTAGLVALLPVYSKLLRKIKTGIAVEDNGEMAKIEISE